jgi:NADPH:quinone reductase-like Zn-dependent oxidoreductase
MKAIVQTGYGSPDVFELREIDRPVAKDGEVLVRIRAAALNAGDVFSMRGSPWLARFSVGFPKPKDYVPGWDLAGHVEAVGEGVTHFQPGDEVFASFTRTLAEYACAAEDKFAPKPANLTFQQAAAVPAAATAALLGLRDAGKLQPGQKVLINGASGGVGTYSVQIAKALGAEVTGVCSTSKVDMVRSLGADHVIDYTKEDFVQSSQRYDLVLDNAGSRSPSDLRRVLTPQGIAVPNTGHGGMTYVFKAYLSSAFSSQQARPFLAVPNQKDLVFLKELIEAGKITPVIDRTYPLSQAAEAIGYLADGHARGKVVITVEHDDSA